MWTENRLVGGGRMNKIELEVVDNSAIAIAHALIKYYMKCNAKKENALIDLEEVSEHINTFVNAERKSMMIEV